MTTDRAARITAMKHALKDRILVIDGAMGTMIQNHALTEADYRKDRFADHNHDLKGNGDLLSLTQPDIIAAIHQQFLDAGADIVITNTFSATTIAQSDYGLSHLVGELNESAAQLAREVADRQSAQTPDKPRWVAGGIGPTNRTATISPDVNDPAFRNTSFDALRDAYLEAARSLVAGGVDILLIETVFDTLNCKAAIFALELLFEELGERLPVLISGTITDRSGRTLTGQTPEAFWNSICHARPLAMGLNCALGAEEMRPHIAELSRVADCFISAYPNAGLPNGFGGYDETPETTAGHIAEWAKTGLLNMVGGCCGTTPEHIRAIADAVAGVTPRKPVSPPRTMRLSGLEPFSFPVDNSATEVPA